MQSKYCLHTTIGKRTYYSPPFYDKCRDYNDFGCILRDHPLIEPLVPLFRRLFQYVQQPFRFRHIVLLTLYLINFLTMNQNLVL